MASSLQLLRAMSVASKDLAPKEQDAIYRVDTVPPPAGEDAYNAPTRVGPMARAAVEKMFDDAAEPDKAPPPASGVRPQAKAPPAPVAFLDDDEVLVEPTGLIALPSESGSVPRYEPALSRPLPLRPLPPPPTLPADLVAVAPAPPPSAPVVGRDKRLVAIAVGGATCVAVAAATVLAHLWH